MGNSRESIDNEQWCSASEHAAYIFFKSDIFTIEGRRKGEIDKFLG